MPTQTPSAKVVFLPWTRQGAAAALSVVDTLGAQPGSATLAAELMVNDAERINMPVRLLGPADVVGVSTREIVRREPPANTSNFEHNLFAAVEFDRPDFPWLFTPARADANGRLRPWLCLIVVRQQQGVTIHPALNAPLPALEISAPAVPADELPDPTESWLWAHAQAASGSSVDVATLRSTLTGHPELSLSRLLCPRLLTPNTDYIACLVPAFETGRKAGLGLPVSDAETLQPAWSSAPNAQSTVTLPVYDHWTFRTGTDGDFKTLAMRLRACPAPSGLGKRAVDISRPGFTLPSTFPTGATLSFEGALQPLSAADEVAWPVATENSFSAALADIVNAAGESTTADPLLTPPLYGRWHAGRETAKRAPAGITWFDELNLDPRHRSVAALGTRVVQEHQEALMASAWQQAGDLQIANQRMRQLQMSLCVGLSLHARHVERMDTGSLLRVAAPAFTRMRSTVSAGNGSAMTLATTFLGTALPLKAMSSSMRKLSRNRGPVSRRLQSAGGISTGLRGLIGQLNVSATLQTAQPPARASYEIIKARALQPQLRRYQEVTEAAIGAVEGAPQFQLMPEGVRIPMPVEGANVVPTDNPVAAAFRAAARAHLKALNPARQKIAALPSAGLVDLSVIRSQLQLQMRPQKHLEALAHAQVLVPDPGSSPEDAAPPLSTIMHAPRFPQPMYEALRDLSQELLLPGLNAVVPNSVIGLRTNQRFVNAYMVGLSFEMGRELLWRGYPTDQCGTYFDQFWDTAGSDAARADIDPIHQWGTRALRGTATTANGKFVMLLRSELLRRYPTASIYAAPAVLINGRRAPNPDPTAEVHPAFRGSLPPDVTFIGFNLTANQATGSSGAGAGYFIVIQEQPTEPRFGLDANAMPAGSTHLRTSSEPPAGVPLRGLQWRKNAAHMAGITRRLPIRIAIHASQLISAQDVV